MLTIEHFEVVLPHSVKNKHCFYIYSMFSLMCNVCRCCLSFCPSSFGHCVVCPSLCLLVIVLSVLLFVFWSLCCLSFSLSFGHCVVCPSLCLLAIVLAVLRFTDSDYPFGFAIFKLFLGCSSNW